MTNNERENQMSIQVNDKVQWVQWRGDTPVEFKGRVESVSSFNGVKTFVIEKFDTFPEDRTQTTISARRVTKI
tara:strand:- start:428 stop:646 length:219 start_codon:yes stop_codon:yes gene_type:complete